MYHGHLVLREFDLILSPFYIKNNIYEQKQYKTYKYILNKYNIQYISIEIKCSQMRDISLYEYSKTKSRHISKYNGI